MSHPLVEFDNVTISREGRIALDAVSLKIAVGEHVAILGPNGSGKSSLIKAITRECYPMHPERSAVRVMGERVWNVFDLRALMGIVTHDLAEACMRGFTGMEVVLSGFFSSVGIWPHLKVSEAMRAAAAEALERMEIAHLAGRWVDELSSGEARRVLIARALVHRPRALVLDEPSTSLDIHAAHSLSGILRKLARQGTSIVLVTHHLADIIPEIERVILLKEGRVFRDGAKPDVLTAPLLGELFRTPVEVVRRDGYYHLW
jgi:iron complex transport system ATP-binding protein